MSKETLIAMGAGALSALASMSFLGGAPAGLLLAYLAPLPIMMAGLGLGPRAATLAAVSGVALAAGSAGLLPAVLYGSVYALPAWVMSRALMMQRTAEDGTQYWFEAGAALSWLSLLAGLMLIGASIMLLGEGGMQVVVTRDLEAALGALAPTLDAQQKERVISALAPVFSAAVGVSWVIMAVVNAMIAQSILKRFGRALRPTPDLAEMVLPQWVTNLLVATAVLALLGPGELSYLGQNLAAVVAVPVFFLGLAVVHSLARRFPFKGALLAGFYVVFVISGMTAFVVVAGVGIFEQWVGLRHRMGDPTNGKEIE